MPDLRHLAQTLVSAGQSAQQNRPPGESAQGSDFGHHEQSSPQRAGAISSQNPRTRNHRDEQLLRRHSLRRVRQSRSCYRPASAWPRILQKRKEEELQDSFCRPAAANIWSISASFDRGAPRAAPRSTSTESILCQAPNPTGLTPRCKSRDASPGPPVRSARSSEPSAASSLSSSETTAAEVRLWVPITPRGPLCAQPTQYSCSRTLPLARLTTRPAWFGIIPRTGS